MSQRSDPSFVSDRISGCVINLDKSGGVTEDVLCRQLSTEKSV